MRGEQSPGVKLPGKDSLTDSSIPKGVGLDGMVKTFKLPLTYRHARKSESLLIHSDQKVRSQDASTLNISTWMLSFRYIGST